ncbi:hypothetical protein SARC_00824 [Sphaeroforma arctica JP610]|uniref:BZIP domain-containing protein n=1 Tax=Sphaeroforma arctica JP610 TaxID=667725 RepID=A0A0L0GDL0_9EUKA|nr:hypothetical protein SARC_00824 [Sphaeroforma arctica JP610]KNC87080.1 hypothetical protein SARC_00824 [Sphaeroforma arctica JP610]|eukprot:XP_014160982.1 hypothetical protein SARC_00824 [Sphaeroforma arctica JP610]
MNKYDTQAVATKSTVTNNTYDNAYGSQDSNNNRVDSGYTSKIASPDVYSAPFNAPNSAKDTDSTNSQQQQQQQHTNLLADPRTNSERAQLPSASTDFRPPTKEEDMAGMNSLMALASVAAAEASSLSQQINTEKRKSKYDIPAIRPGSLSATAAPAHAVDHQALYDKYERSSWMFSETASQKSEEGSFYDYVPGDFTEFGEKKGLKRRERNREAALLCRKKKRRL